MIDILGTLYTLGTYNSEGKAVTPPVPLMGYHVNTPELIPQWESFRVLPSTPRRVFGGNSTYFYTFASEAVFLEQRKLANLDPVLNPEPVL